MQAKGLVALRRRDGVDYTAMTFVCPSITRSRWRINKCEVLEDRKASVMSRKDAILIHPRNSPKLCSPLLFRWRQQSSHFSPLLTHLISLHQQLLHQAMSCVLGTRMKPSGQARETSGDASFHRSLRLLTMAEASSHTTHAECCTSTGTGNMS